MRKSIFLLLLIASAFNIATYGQKAVWQEFLSKEGSFKLLLPGTPTKETDQSPQGTVDFQYELKTDYLFYKFGFSKIPVSPKADDSAVMKSFWDKYVANMEKTEGVKVLSQNDFQAGGAFGREVVMDNGELILINRYIARNYYFYTLMTMTYKDNHKNPAIEQMRRKYLDSFEFLSEEPKQKQ